MDATRRGFLKGLAAFVAGAAATREARGELAPGPHGEPPTKVVLPVARSFDTVTVDTGGIRVSGMCLGRNDEGLVSGVMFTSEVPCYPPHERTEPVWLDWEDDD